MSKITNLIGTTWTIDGEVINTQVPEAYGDFDILSSFTFNTDDGIVTYNTTRFAIGYNAIKLDDGGYSLDPLDNVISIYALNFDEQGDGWFPLGMYSMFLPSYEFTITGGEDISNPLFIDFINTYGTLVSGGEPPTAEGVKSKLQSLITASNRKTGNNDTNLTDAVRALVDGYGQGEEVAEYDGAVVIEDAAEEEPEKTYSLTITNTGDHIYNEYIYYSVDSEEYGDLQIEANSTLKIDGIKNYVYCRAGTEFRETSTVLNNCTIEWLDSASCKIYPTGDNATATLESYD